MTDVSDLRRRLGELADETPEVSPKQWLAATRHRIRVHHRVRVTGAVGAVALLLAVERPILIRNADRTWDSVITQNLPGIRKTMRPGPEGWADSVEKLLEEIA